MFMTINARYDLKESSSNIILSKITSLSDVGRNKGKNIFYFNGHVPQGGKVVGYFMFC